MFMQIMIKNNANKTKVMRINASNSTSITINSNIIQDVENFTYLGIIITTGGSEGDIKSRIGKAKHVFILLRPIWLNKNITIKTKIKISNSNVKSVLTVVLLWMLVSTKRREWKDVNHCQ